MFRLSDSTRRQTTMGLFVLLCVVPTIVVIATGLWRCLPGRIAAEQRRLTLLFGQPVRIEAVRYLRPGAALYEGIAILDPETNEVLLQCDRLRAQLVSVQPEGATAPYPQLQLLAGKLTLGAISIEAFRPMADRLLQRRIEGAPPSVDLAVKQFALASHQSEFPARAWVTLQPQESKVELKFQWEGQTNPTYLCLARNRKYEPPVDGFLLVTGDSPLPCSLLSTILPPFPELGSGSRFQGGIGGNFVPEGWELEVKGILHGIELRKLVADHLPHEISGIGSLRIDHLEMRAGRISDAEGSLKAANGRISRDLVASLAQELELNSTFPRRGSTALLLYDELAGGFHLDGSGLQIWGDCTSEPAGALLIAYAHRLDGPDAFAEPIRPTKAIAALTSTPEIQLSMSRHADSLKRRMPSIPAASTLIIAEKKTTARPVTRP